MRIQLLDETKERAIIPMGGTLVRNKPDPAQVRKGITRVHVFERNEDGVLVADVEHEADIKRFLQLREGFMPYGEEAEQEALEKYRWLRDLPEPVAEEEDLPPGQPPVVTEIFDEDGNLTAADESDDEADDGPGSVVPEGFEQPELGDLPSIPGESADGSEWVKYAASLPGMPTLKTGNLSKDESKKQQDTLASALRDYTQRNYGVTLKGNLGVLRLAKEVGKLQEAHAG